MDRLVESVIRASPPDGLFERRIERHPNLAGSASWTSHPVFHQLTGNPLGLAGNIWTDGSLAMPKYVAVVLLCLWLATTFTVGAFLLTRVNVIKSGSPARKDVLIKAPRDF